VNRRRFLRTVTQSGSALGLTCVAAVANRQAAIAARSKRAAKPSFRDAGWVWEGQGIDPKVPPSIYGIGQGARYFGLSRVNYLRDYTQVAPIPVDRVIVQMEGIADLIGKGRLAGYSILGAVLIDGHRAQADAVRDFISAQS
jgi:hypothetical protein